MWIIKPFSIQIRSFISLYLDGSNNVVREYAVKGNRRKYKDRFVDHDFDMYYIQLMGYSSAIDTEKCWGHTSTFFLAGIEATVSVYMKVKRCDRMKYVFFFLLSYIRFIATWITWKNNQTALKKISHNLKRARAALLVLVERRDI